MGRDPSRLVLRDDGASPVRSSSTPYRLRCGALYSRASAGCLGAYPPLRHLIYGADTRVSIYGTSTGLDCSVTHASTLRSPSFFIFSFRRANSLSIRHGALCLPVFTGSPPLGHPGHVSLMNHGRTWDGAVVKTPQKRRTQLLHRLLCPFSLSLLLCFLFLCALFLLSAQYFRAGRIR